MCSAKAQLTLLEERGGLIEGEEHMERSVMLGVELHMLEVEISLKRRMHKCFFFK